MEKQSEQERFVKFNWQIPKIIASLPEGEDAGRLYNYLSEDIESNYNNNPNMRVISYDEDTKSLIGSNIFTASRLDELLEPSGIRVAIPADDTYGDISRLLKGRFYTYFNALVLRTAEDSYSKNDKITKDLANKVEERQRKLKLPVMIIRPLVRYSKDSEGYKLLFELGNKTQIIEDERLDVKNYPSGMKFSKVDDIGLPLFNKEGKRTWYAREDGLSWFVLDWYLDLY